MGSPYKLDLNVKLTSPFYSSYASPLVTSMINRVGSQDTGFQLSSGLMGVGGLASSKFLCGSIWRPNSFGLAPGPGPLGVMSSLMIGPAGTPFVGGAGMYGSPVFGAPGLCAPSVAGPAVGYWPPAGPVQQPASTSSLDTVADSSPTREPHRETTETSAPAAKPSADEGLPKDKDIGKEVERIRTAKAQEKTKDGGDAEKYSPAEMKKIVELAREASKGPDARKTYDDILENLPPKPKFEEPKQPDPPPPAPRGRRAPKPEPPKGKTVAQQKEAYVKALGDWYARYIAKIDKDPDTSNIRDQFVRDISGGKSDYLKLSDPETVEGTKRSVGNVSIRDRFAVDAVGKQAREFVDKKIAPEDGQRSIYRYQDKNTGDWTFGYRPLKADGTPGDMTPLPSTKYRGRNLYFDEGSVDPSHATNVTGFLGRLDEAGKKYTEASAAMVKGAEGQRTKRVEMVRDQMEEVVGKGNVEFQYAVKTGALNVVLKGDSEKLKQAIDAAEKANPGKLAAILGNLPAGPKSAPTKITINGKDEFAFEKPVDGKVVLQKIQDTLQGVQAAIDGLRKAFAAAGEAAGKYGEAKADTKTPADQLQSLERTSANADAALKKKQEEIKKSDASKDPRVKKALESIKDYPAAFQKLKDDPKAVVDIPPEMQAPTPAAAAPAAAAAAAAPAVAPDVKQAIKELDNAQKAAQKATQDKSTKPNDAAVTAAYKKAFEAYRAAMAKLEKAPFKDDPKAQAALAKAKEYYENVRYGNPNGRPNLV
jgi:hypothetical protein